MPSLFIIDPDAALDYKFDWASWLAVGETIDTYTLTHSTGITVDSSAKTDADTSVTVWVSDAVATKQTVTCHIVSTEGRTDDRTMRFRVENR